MAPRNFVVSLAIALLGLVALVVPAEAGRSGGKGGGSACERWGSAKPDSLANGEARKAILCLINEKRQNAGLKPLDRSKKLQRAAQRHNDHMLETGCFSHECSGEAGLGVRLDAVDYIRDGLSAWAYGENIAWGLGERGTPRAIVGAWMDSAGHRANILSRDFREIGVGFSAGTPNGKSEPGGIYTTDFGLAVG